MKIIDSVIKKSYKKSICAWCNNVIGIFPIDNDVDIISHGICEVCLEKCLKKDLDNNKKVDINQLF